ncbi:MAG: ImmA/IrrE family metallo-endopeptidase [Chloroflexota bacterium]|nr:ImmA/IrrE family metallo-endopeptidase [Chloroflexota bacterium]
MSVSETNRTYTADMATVREAERDAEKLLESWWESPAKDRPLPVDPIALARRLGIRVHMAPLDPDESGNIYFPPEGAAVISLNRGDAATRQRFTCAHEIGHYVRRQANPSLHRSSFIDYRDTLAGLGVDTEEIYANQFAAALLMPAHLVARWHRSGDGVESLARRFGTSAQAMELRLRNLRLT